MIRISFPAINPAVMVAVFLAVHPAVIIGVFILARTWNLGRSSLQILLQAAPDGLDIDEVRSKLDDISGVVEIHDLHVWTLTSEMDVATLHLVTEESTDPHPVLDRARDLLESEYGKNRGIIKP